MRHRTMAALAAASIVAIGATAAGTLPAGAQQGPAQAAPAAEAGAPPEPAPSTATPAGPEGSPEMRHHDMMRRMMMHGMMGRGMEMRGGGLAAPGTFALFPRIEDKQLTPSDVQAIAQAILLWHGNHSWKVADVHETPANKITFSFATSDNSVVARFEMDRRTGRITRTG